MKENWKDIKNYEGLYQISNFGRIKSLKKWCGNKYVQKWTKCEKILKQAKHYHGYKYVILSKNKETKKEYVHRLVARAFLNNDNEYKEINHKDGNKQNNCVENLEWCDRSWNVSHSYKSGLLVPKRSKNNVLSKAVIQYDKNGSFIKKWDCIKDVFRELNIKDISITKCCKNQQKTAGGYIWKYEKEKLKNG